MNESDSETGNINGGKAERVLQSIGILLELEKRIRKAPSEKELAFIMVNETFQLSQYRQAVLWKKGGIDRVAAVSGLAVPDCNAPFIVWINRIFKHLEKNFPPDTGICPLAMKDFSDDMAVEWPDFLPSNALWLPMTSGDGKRSGAIIMARDIPWSDAEKYLLACLADAFSHAWNAAATKGRKSWTEILGLKKKKTGIAAAAITVLMSFLPVHQSVLAPAEIIPEKPVMVRSPLDGVIDRFEIMPNDRVSDGQPIITLDSTRLKNRLEIARKALEVTEAEYRQAAQMAIFDQKSKILLASLKGQMEQHSAEVDYIRQLLERIVIRAPVSGIAIFDDQNEWIGRPVATGERILMVADPSVMELEIRLPVSDAIAFEKDAEVRLFLNTAPHRPVEAKLRYSGYQASATPDGHFAYRLVASFTENPEFLRIGLKGTAKIKGRKTILLLHILRKPFVTLRRTLGL